VGRLYRGVGGGGGLLASRVIDSSVVEGWPGQDHEDPAEEADQRDEDRGGVQEGGR
jgi:hypothetical protein